MRDFTTTDTSTSTLDWFQMMAVLQRSRDPRTIDFLTIRLTEEAGEVAGVVKRASRKLMGEPLRGKRSMVAADRAKLYDEMSDVLHTLAQLADASGISLSTLAKHALDKQGSK